MTQPETYKSYRRTTGELPLTIEPATEKLPKDLGATEVLIKIQAVSLNFRDVGMLDGRYIAPVSEHGITASDCSAEVVALGSDVQSVRVGDRVAPIFFTNCITGQEDDKYVALGGDLDGVLREYAIFDEKVLVHLPEYLSWEEASTIPCAGVTAWNALNKLDGLSDKDYVLLEGTGGVSMFALLLLVVAGVKTIITSSSDEKLESIKKLSPLIQGINYKTNSDLTAEVQRLTNGKGAKIIINNSGVSSIPSNVATVARKGSISLVGFLEGFEAEWNPNSIYLGLMGKCARIQGIIVGSKVDFESLNKFLADKKLRLNPLIDRTFSLKESKEAFEHLNSGSHVGKVVVKPQE